MKKIILSLIFSFSLIVSHSQSGFSDQLASEGRMMTMVKKSRENIDIEGTPYIFEKFQPVKITGHEDKNFQARYNGYNGDLEVLDVGKGTVFVLNKYLTNYDVNFIAQRKIYRSYKYISKDGDITNGFFVKLSDNNGLSLLKKENVKFYKEVKAVSTYDKARPAKYRRANDQYFIKIKDNDAREFSTKKKDIAKFFPKHSKDILGYIKSNKLNTKDEAGLIKLMHYISRL